ncbi:phospholipase/carboxylesterase [Coniochaeta sp. 2T2.1]|nr:phospholipase/carboxylesterase [Coniochaeta sp. 2T2.1]
MSQQDSTSASASPPPVIVEPVSAHTYTPILLHGMGSNGENFGRALLETGITSSGQRLPQLLPGAKFIFPTAARRRSTAFGRAILNMWFDKARMQDPSYRKETQLQGLEESAREILELIHHEESVNNIAPENIILGGLSQGCAMALTVLLCLNHCIGGFVGMSGYLPFREDIDEAVAPCAVEDGHDNPFASDEGGAENYPPAVRASVFERDLLGLPAVDGPAPEKTAYGTPTFLGHGSADDKVLCSLGESEKRSIEGAGYEAQWRCYQGLGHWYKVPDEIDDVVKFIRTAVGWQIADSRE